MELNYKRKLMISSAYNNSWYKGLRFTAEENGVQFTLSVGGKIKYYGPHDNKWYNVEAGEAFPAIALKKGEPVIICGSFTDGAVSSTTNTGNGTFSSVYNKKFSVSGNIMSLIGQYDIDDPNDETFHGNDSLSNKHIFAYLFANCSGLVDASELKLPAVSLSQNCYTGMFYGCTSLTKAPDLLPATTLATYCYNSMFYGCTSLIKAPDLLPATTLATYCYIGMFYGCTSLTKAPALPAATLKSFCYGNMFHSCSKLSYIEIHATSITAMMCLNDWVSGVAKSGIFKVADTDIWSVNNDASYGFSKIPYDKDNKWKVITTTGHLHSDNPLSIDNGLTKAIIVKFNNQQEFDSLQYKIEDTTNISGVYSDFNNLNALQDGVGVVVPSGKSIILFGSSSKFYNAGPDRGIGYFNITDSSGNTISVNSGEKLSVSGSILSMVFGVKYRDYTELTPNIALCGLFKNTPITHAGNLELNYGLSNYCYSYMFSGCDKLIQCPSLEKLDLKPYCYYRMFNNCTRLTMAPSLPATTLFPYCYSEMFTGCSSLTSVSSTYLPATNLSEGCYSGMFTNCSSLISTPSLSATTLAPYCYKNMFMDCTSLVNGPSLPATNLSEGCYSGMFANCSSLTSTPSLPATTLFPYCYNEMFTGCSSLISVSSSYLPATNLSEGCYSGMFTNCSSLTGTPNLSATILAPYCYKNMFMDCTSLVNGPSLPTTNLMGEEYNNIPVGNDANLKQGNYDCYTRMFSGCTSLVSLGNITGQPIILPATKLSSGCYKYMFENCTSITSVEIKSTSPKTCIYMGEQYYAFDCYKGMFMNCNKLSQVKMHDLDIWGGIDTDNLSNDVYEGDYKLSTVNYMGGYAYSDWWLSGVSINGSFTKNKTDNNTISKLGYSYINYGGNSGIIGAIPSPNNLDGVDYNWTINYNI